MDSTSSGIQHSDDGTVAVIGLPLKYHFGIDMKMWETGEKFMGVRGMSRGVHYIYYSSEHDEVRQGFFHFTSTEDGPGVFKWDPRVESLVAPESIHEREAIAGAVVSDIKLLTGLAPYSQCIDDETAEMWEEATSFITKELVQRIQPINGAPISSSQEMSEAETVFWTRIPKLRAPKEMSPAERSEYHLNRCQYIGEVLSGFRSHEEMIGELQASFILFLLGLNYEAFMQWKRILEVLLGCKEKAVSENIVLFTNFTRALWFQIKQLPVDLMSDPTIMGDEDEDEDNRLMKRNSNVFIIPILAEFIEVCRDDSLVVNKSLQKNISRIDSEMKSKFGLDWKFDHISPPDDPLVIPL